MTTVDDWLKNAKYVRDHLLEEIERITYANENEIIRLQTNQIDDSIGFDGKPLKNAHPLFDGVYSLATQFYAEGQNYMAPKIAGQKYNFLATGDFFRGMDINVSDDITKINIFSTGTGSGRKSQFFKGYTNLFGLVDNNTKIVNYDIILPELQKFVKKHL